MATITGSRYKDGHEIFNKVDLLHYQANTIFKLRKNPPNYNYSVNVSKKTDTTVYVEDSSGNVLRVCGAKSKMNLIFLHVASVTKKNKGLSFETELASDLMGETSYHPEVVERIKGIVGDRKFTIREMGGMNTRRSIKIDAQGLYVHSRDTKLIGDMIADLVIDFEDGTYENLSLKFSNSYSILNCGIMKYIKDDIDRREFLSALGVDYIRFEEDFNIQDEIGYEPLLNESPVLMLENLIKSSLGSNYIMVHKRDEDEINVDRMPLESTVKVTDIEYSYRSETNKYFRMKMVIIINGKSFHGSLSIRNINGGVVPHVISLFLRKKVDKKPKI